MKLVDYSKPMIIFHSADCDGIFSCWVVKKFLQTKNVKNNKINYYAWNYNDSVDFERLKEASIIFMVDITLPEKYMSRFANKIVWIDHHYASIINSINSEWRDKLYKNYSSINFKNTNKQISACELCWISLFDKKIPEMVKLAGRYDVWDKTTIEPDYLNAYTREYFVFGTEKLTDIWELGNILKFLDNVYEMPSSEFRKNILDEGKKCFKRKKEENKKLCDEIAKIGEICDEKVAIAENLNCNSEFFESVYENDKSIKYVIAYGFNTKNDNWKISIYNTPSNKNGSSLKLLEKIYSKNSKLFSSHGGHKKACGAVVDDIEKTLLSLFIKK